MTLKSRLTGGVSRALPAVVATVFLLSCLVPVAHWAMAEGEGCQSVELSVRGCGPTISHDTTPALPPLVTSLDSSPEPIRRALVTLQVGGSSQQQIAPLVPRSPPLLFA